MKGTCLFKSLGLISLSLFKVQFASEGNGTHCHIFLTSQVAYRGLGQACGTELRVQFLSNLL